ncbi:MAG: hypothetical protein P4L46_21415 [Fimbriimonas sp.]|nr:hypothetical protein [Fimbriimonas sp.]
MNLRSEAPNLMTDQFLLVHPYRPELTGWVWDKQAPRYQLAPIGERGYIEGRPVRSIAADSKA